MSYEPAEGEWVRVVTWRQDPSFSNRLVRHEEFGLCVRVDGVDPPWFVIRFPQGLTIHYESYSLEKLSLLYQLALAADERYSGSM